MSELFIAIYQKLHKKPAVFYIILALLLSGSLFVISGIKFTEDLTSMIPDDERIGKINSLLSQSKFSDQLVFNIHVDSNSTISADSIISYTDKLMSQIGQDSVLIKEVVYKVDNSNYKLLYEFFYNHIPFYLDSNDYSRIEKQLQVDELNATLEKDFKILVSPTGIAIHKQVLNDPLSLVPKTFDRLKNFQFDENFQIYDSHIFTKDHRHLLTFVVPVNPSGDIKSSSKLIKNIDRIISENKHPHIKAEYYGGTAVAVANANRIEKDIILTVSITLILLISLFIFAFKKLKIISIIFFPMILSIIIALALLIIIEGPVSIMALGIGAVLLGITIDYSLHFYSHYRHSGDIKGTIKTLSQPLLMSSATTAMAFLCLILVRSEALNQLGYLAALSITLVAITVLTLAAFLMGKYLPATSFSGNRLDRFKPITTYAYEKNKIIVLLIVLITLILFILPGSVGFNGDLASLNYQPTHLKEAEKNLTSISTQAMSNLYLVALGKDLDQVLNVTQRHQSFIDSLIAEGLVRKKSSAADLILSKENQQKKIDDWNRFWDKMDRRKVQDDITKAGVNNFFKPNAFNGFYDLLNKEFKPVSLAEFSELRSLFLKNYIYETDTACTGILILRVDEKNKQAVFDRINKTTNELVIFDKKVFINKFFDILKEDFNTLSWVSTVLVFVILLIIFGRIELALVTQIPLMLSWFWTIGFMNLFNIEFNIFNVILSTYILGLGIDYCIFMVHGSMNKNKFGETDLSPYRLSILLSVLTTIFGLGALIFAKHPAIKSIAAVSVVGILSSMIMAYTLVPLLFSTLVSHKGKKRLEPITMGGVLISLSAFTLFLLGSITLTILIPVLYILPLSRKKVKYIFHFLVSKCLKFIVYSIFPVKKNIDVKNVDFSKPSIIVCNHQSHLDLALVLMLHPKILVLTNKWVWNNPFYGFIVHFSDFYPTHEGLDDKLVERLSIKVKEGYSILIFPEGSRSVDGKIHRFHQGAFWLADRLNLDIQPLLLHGANHCLPKTEFFLRKGIITLTSMERIKVTHVEDDHSYRDQASTLCSLYRRKFNEMSGEIETTEYYSSKLVKDYIYKGPVLEWYVRIKILLENKYSNFNKILPNDASIVDIGCGYGLLSHMLHKVSDRREILGLDNDENKIAIAQNINGSSTNLKFEAADILNYELPYADAFILLDIIHYLPSEYHRTVIEKCINKLNKNGIIIIRDADSDLTQKMWRTRFNEFNSTRLFKFNKTNYKSLSFTSGSVIEQIALDHNFMVERWANSTGSPDTTFVLKPSVR